MKQILLPLNIVLIIAVAILYFLHFGKSKTAVPSASTVTTKDSAGNVVVKPLKIAYVDLDSIQENYVYYKEKMDEFEKKKDRADRELNGAFQKIENERISFVQRGNAITQIEAENFQREYTRKMENLENQKRSMENNIQQEGVKTMEELKKKINDFLAIYNKTQEYSYIFSYSSTINMLFYKDTTYNITNEVVAGLNEEHNKTKVKK
ncbi:OmpH family outer membrane protein [Pollutibacter soli]|uniref:OmpH family outer membrane protein n=1 Tax=Pollutibacter soli TaxID=3034157 RepID=UPI0030140608